MRATTPSISDTREASEEQFDRLASRLAEEADLEFEEICRRANQRLDAVLGYAVDQGAPVERRLEQLGERLGQ